jgi:hypothetical protein
MNLPRIPVPGEPLKADWAKDVVNCLRALRLSVSGACSLQQTPEGQSLSIKPSALSPYSISEPFDVVFSGADCTFSNCDIPHGTVTTLHADIAYTVTGSDGDIWLALKIDTSDYTAEIIEGATKASVIDQTIPEDKYIRRLLYRLRKATSDATPPVVTLTVTFDARRNPVQVAYV